MIRYIFVRIIWIFIILISFMSIMFIMIRLLEYRRYGIDFNMSDTVIPMIFQYFRWLKGVFTEWDWGQTPMHLNLTVWEVIIPKLPVTIRVNVVAFLVYIPLGIIFGVIAALQQNKRMDNVITLITMVFMSIPSFVFMFLILLLFSYTLHWFPSQYPTSDSEGIIQYTGLVLPTFALSVGPIANLTRLIRGELTETLNSQYLLLARTKGLTKRQAVMRHAFRVSMVPIIPTMILYVVTVLSGSLVIERIYSIPGTGRLFFKALSLNSYDYNMIVALSAFYTAISLVSTLIVDLTYGIIDPRIRMGSRK